MTQTVLWWGNFDAEYSRNRIMRLAFQALGWNIHSFIPKHTKLAFLEAIFKRVTKPDLIFVPCFCQKDIDTALCFGRHTHTAVMIDPLISLFDSRVLERKTVAQGSRKAAKLLQWERQAFSKADAVLADTAEHARFFHEVLGVEDKRLSVVPVGAEERVFYPETTVREIHDPVEVFFYGSFIPLQGVDIIVDAILSYQGPPVVWCLLGGSGTAIRAQAQEKLQGRRDVQFENEIAYDQLAQRIQAADILLGVFGSADKTARVIPNKVYQAMACGKPVISCEAPYPFAIDEPETGIVRIEAGNPCALADAVTKLAADKARLQGMGAQARKTYDKYFSQAHIHLSLDNAIKHLQAQQRRN